MVNDDENDDFTLDIPDVFADVVSDDSDILIDGEEPDGGSVTPVRPPVPEPVPEPTPAPAPEPPPIPEPEPAPEPAKAAEAPAPVAVPIPPTEAPAQVEAPKKRVRRTPAAEALASPEQVTKAEIAPAPEVPKKVAMEAGRAEQIVREMKGQLKNDEELVSTWKEIVLESGIIFRGKQYELSDVLRSVRGLCKLPKGDMTTPQVREKELALGNLMQLVTTELAMAQHGRDVFAEQKKDYLAKARDTRKTQAVIEAELAATSEEYQYVRSLWLSADLNAKFWKTMYEMVEDTLERLRQVYNTLSTEARFTDNINQGVPTTPPFTERI